MPAKKVDLTGFLRVQIAMAWLSHYLPDDLGERLQRGEDPEALAAETIGRIMFAIGDEIREAARQGANSVAFDD